MAEPARITVNDAAQRLSRSEDVVFLDSRSEASYQAATLQIPGSIRVPPDDVASALDRIPRSRLLVPYCT
jgi:rhodanese-related sulfurtransferase